MKLASKIFASLAMLAAAGASFSANAGNVSWSVTLSGPAPVYYQPAPVYVQPAPVYVQPAPVYYRPAPVYVQPAPVYVQPAPIYYRPAPVYVQPAPVYYGRPVHGHQPHWRHHRGQGHVDGRVVVRVGG
jgi:hypothetical protein